MKARRYARVAVLIPGPSETISPGTVEGVHAASEVRLILGYGSYSEAFERGSDE